MENIGKTIFGIVHSTQRSSLLGLFATRAGLNKDWIRSKSGLFTKITSCDTKVSVNNQKNRTQISRSFLGATTRTELPENDFDRVGELAEAFWQMVLTCLCFLPVSVIDIPWTAHMFVRLVTHANRACDEIALSNRQFCHVNKHSERMQIGPIPLRRLRL